ncbi:MAG: hypothetical protein ACE5FW_02130, partial [Candidatus Aenigmatarchaeota archaeon]
MLEKRSIVKTQLMASKCLWVNRAALGALLRSFEVILARALSSRRALHGFKTIRLATHPKASLATRLCEALKIPSILNTN